ncbi:MAG: hypothetical protein ACK4GO_13375 [Gemmobacter sp.]
MQGIDRKPSELVALTDRLERDVNRGLNLLAALEVIERQLWDHEGLQGPSDVKLIFGIAGVRESLGALLSDMHNRAVEAENREILGHAIGLRR